MVDFEELLCKVSGALYQHDTPILLKVAEKLNVTGLEGMTRAKLIRRLRDQMEELEEWGRGGRSTKAHKWVWMQGAPNVTGSTPSQWAVSIPQEEWTFTIPSSGSTVPGFIGSNSWLPPPPPPDLPQGLANIRAGWRHQSEGGLSFSSLHHQIKAAVTKGYSEGEVVEAVLRAINPGLRLRSYLWSWFPWHLSWYAKWPSWSPTTRDVAPFQKWHHS